MMGKKFMSKITLGLWFACAMDLVHAGTPLWTLSPLTQTNITVATNETATVSYQVTNQSRKTHALGIKNIPGVTQITTSGNCQAPFTLGYNESCTLNLSINGSTLSGDIVGGPLVCEQSNLNQCYQPSPDNSLHIIKENSINNTTLSTSVDTLALSVTGITEYGISGTPSSGIPRIITITNTGSYTAVNLSVIEPTWPTGTSSSTTCGSTLAASSSCTITITPGAIATSDGTNPCSNGTAPIPQEVQVIASNATSVSTDVIILSYACIYQGGYIYAFDDTTPNTASVAGKVITTSDQAAAYPNGIIWSSDGSGGETLDAAYDAIYGISEISTTSAADPNTGQVAGQTACNGKDDGLCNTNNIYVYYQNNATNAPIHLFYYAAGLCKQTIDGYSDWYLPAICEMGDEENVCKIAVLPRLQNIQNSLINISGLSSLDGAYSSSTEYSQDAANDAAFQLFSNIGGSGQGHAGKGFKLGVRCSRAF